MDKARLFFSCTGLGTGAPIFESPYGDGVAPEEAPESISRAVASLPPEQMFELMKQMKVGWFIMPTPPFFLLLANCALIKKKRRKK